MGKYWGKDTTSPALPATNLGPKRIAGGPHAVAEGKDEGIILTLKGMPTLSTDERNEQP